MSPSAEADNTPVELYPPVDDDGWHASQVRDWISVCPELSDSAIRFYLILRSLVIDKRGPVRVLTLFELCHLMPKRPLQPGETEVQPSSLSRIRGLLEQLTAVGLVTTPEGLRLTTSSRALAGGRGLRLRINLMPRTSYTGPRNTFDRLDAIREVAAESAKKARQRELDLAAAKRAKRAEERARNDAGQNSDPGGAGQNSDPRGQNSDPRGQNSDPDLGSDLQDRKPPLSLSAQSFRSDLPPSVRPSVQEEDAHARTDGRTDGADSGEEQAAEHAAAAESGAQAAHQETTPGMGVLLSVGRVNKELRLVGKPLVDQGQALDRLIAQSEAAGDPWSISELITVLAAPLDGPIRRTVGAVMAYRITQLPRTPRMAAGMMPAQKGPADQPVQEATQVPAGRRTACEGLIGAHGVCDQLALPGERYCARCLTGADPLCSNGCGRKVVVPGEPCIICRQPGRSTDEDPDRCPGHAGRPCGRPAQAGGMCGRCRTEAETARNLAQAEWDRSVAAAAATVAVQGAAAPTAPF